MVSILKEERGMSSNETISEAAEVQTDPPPITRPTSRVINGRNGTNEREDGYGEEALHRGADHRVFAAV